MEAQATQQAPPTPYARPQQLTDSPAASLPTETLTQILDLALQDLKPLERHKTRIALSKVCQQWWTVAASERELVVQGSKQAGRLAEALLQADTVERQEAVKSLVIELDGITDKSDAKPAADLLLCCPKLERLSLTFTGGLNPDAKYRMLGKHLRDALTTCNSLTELELLGNVIVRPNDFDSIINQMPSLRKLIVPAADLRTVWAYEHLSPALNSLETLHISITDYTTPKDIAQMLINSSLTTIKSVRLGLDRRGRFTLEEVARALLPAAGQLLDLELPETLPDPAFNGPPLDFPLLISRLSSIRSLSLGIVGYAMDELFTILTPLDTLESLTLRAPSWFPPGFPKPIISYTSTLDYVRSASRGKFKTLSLPGSLVRDWTEAEIDDVRRVSREFGVELGIH